MKKFLSSERNFNLVMTTLVLLVLALPVGLANIWLGYFIGENPCTRCWYSRNVMIFIGVLGIFVLRYGFRMKYLWSIIFCCFVGIYMALSQTSKMIDLDIAQGFGDAIMGAHTYSWGVFVFWFGIIAVCAILFFIRPENPVSDELAGKTKPVKKFSTYTKVVLGLSLFVIVSNAFQAFFADGVPPYTGKGRPGRFSLDLAMTSQDWKSGLWNNFNKPWTMRGPFAVELPLVPGVNETVSVKIPANAADGPIAPAGKVQLVGTKELPFAPEGCLGKGTVTGIDYSPAQGKFSFITNNAGIYFTDPEIKAVTDKAIVDKPNGNDIKITADNVFTKEGLVGVSHNKTLYGAKLVKPEDVKPWWVWRMFREATPGFMPLWNADRPWLKTVRARMSFVLSAAYDPETNTLITVSVPNNKEKKTILSYFNMTDKTLDMEKVLKADPALLKDKNIKNLGYYINGATLMNGKLIALSPAYSSLLVIDPKEGKVENVYELPKLSNPHSLAAKGDYLYALGLENGKNIVYELKLPQS